MTKRTITNNAMKGKRTYGSQGQKSYRDQTLTIVSNCCVPSYPPLPILSSPDPLYSRTIGNQGGRGGANLANVHHY